VYLHQRRQEDGTQTNPLAHRQMQLGEHRQRQNKDVKINKDRQRTLDKAPVNELFWQPAREQRRPRLSRARRGKGNLKGHTGPVDEEVEDEADVHGDAHGLVDGEDLKVEEQDGAFGEEDDGTENGALHKEDLEGCQICRRSEVSRCHVL